MNELTTNEQPEARYALQLSTAQEARQIAEVKAALTVAQAAPRNQFAARNRVLMACQRPKLAATATYQYNRGGTDVTGPSIRLAEALAQNWGNIDFGWREISSENGESLVETYAWDLETNTRRVTQFKVPHSRYTRKNGNTALVDPRDIYEMVANNAARRMRACILAVIPADIVEEAIAACNNTSNAQFDGKKSECIKALIADYEAVGVVQKQIEVFVARNLSSISAGQYINLQRILTSINEGLAKPDNWFAPIEVQTGLDSGLNQIDTKQKNTPPKTEESQKAPPPPVAEPQIDEKPEEEPEPPVAEEENSVEISENGAPAGETDTSNTNTTKEEEASDSPLAGIAKAKTWEELLNFESVIKDYGDIEIKEARKALYLAAEALRRTGVAVPKPAEHPRVFLWLLANGGPIAIVKDAFQALMQTDNYKRLDANAKAVIASKYKTAIG